MPLNKKGKKIMSSMKKQYGKKRGEQVFYASLNKKKIKTDFKIEIPDWKESLKECIIKLKQ